MELALCDRVDDIHEIRLIGFRARGRRRKRLSTYPSLAVAYRPHAHRLDDVGSIRKRAGVRAEIFHGAGQTAHYPRHALIGDACLRARTLSLKGRTKQDRDHNGTQTKHERTSRLTQLRAALQAAASSRHEAPSRKEFVEMFDRHRSK